MSRTKTVLWPVVVSLVAGLSFGLLACRWRFRNASAEIDRQRLEGAAEAERLRLRLTAVSDAAVSDAAVSDAAVSDAAVSDAAVSDAAVSDAASSDTGVSDTGGSDTRSVPAVTTMPSTVATRTVTSAGRNDGPDDLKRIKGIGPAIEQALHGIGIVSFEQIANFTPADVEQVSEALGGFPRRIERDDWVGSARRLLEARSEEGTGEGGGAR